MMSPEYIKERVQSIIQLPALPAVAMEVVEMVDNPRTSASKLGKVISTDQALTAKVLKIANSPFYGFPRKISTIDFAIIVLGYDALKEIVISISLISSLQKKSDGLFDAKGFWDHAIATGVLARRLARDLGYRVTEEVFVGGLLHDMGISVLHRYFKSEYRRIVEIARESELTFLEAEERPRDHARRDRRLARRAVEPPAASRRGHLDAPRPRQGRAEPGACGPDSLRGRRLLQGRQRADRI